MNKLVYFLKNTRWLLLSFIVVFLDLIAKFLVVVNCVYGELIYISPFINFYYVYNFGIAFSLLSVIGAKYNFLLSFIIILIIFILIFILCSLDTNCSCLSKVGYSMIIGGALGNVFSRMYCGGVIDFIDFHIGRYHWPTFNVADLGIFIGFVCILCKRDV